MKIVRARFQSTIRVGSKEFNFIDGPKEKIEMEAGDVFLVATKGASRVLIPYDNIAYLEEDVVKEVAAKVTRR